MRLAPLTGLLAVILLAVSFAVSGDPPDFEATGGEVIEFYADEDDEQMFSAALTAWGALAFLFFAGYLRGLLRRTEDAGVLSGTAFGGAIVATVGLAVFAAIAFTLADAASESTLDPGAAQVLHVMNNDFFFPVAIGFAAFFLAAGLAIVRHGAMAAWFGWTAIVIGALAATPLGEYDLLAGLAWILVVSLVLGLRTEPTAPPPAV